MQVGAQLEPLSARQEMQLQVSKTMRMSKVNLKLMIRRMLLGVEKNDPLGEHKMVPVLLVNLFVEWNLVGGERFNARRKETGWSRSQWNDHLIQLAVEHI